ncbi:MAG: hemerythrin domain-containing protein [Candidatus Methanofastidiosia archaeon]
MKPTEQLKEEHEAIKLMLRILEMICKKLESGEEINPEHLSKILEFIKIFADKCHHGKEEDLLFPAMEKVGIPKEGGPIGVMLLEHDEGRDYIKGMSEAVAKYKTGDGKAFPKIVENARKYITLLTQHIDKEDNILYPMADMHLLKEKQEELLSEFERVEREKIGVSKHEEFHKLLNYLKGVYLE